VKRPPMPPRKTPLTAKTGLRRSTPLQQGSASMQPGARKNAPRKRVAMKTSAPKPKLTPAQKAPLLERSGGWCELRIPGVCVVVGHDVAHRVGEGMGGRKGEAAKENDRLSNVLWACRYCHRHTHDYPATARGHGWMLRRGADPRRSPVFYNNLRWVLLDDAGGYTPYREGGAA
jgi:hypothetical protein